MIASDATAIVSLLRLELKENLADFEDFFTFLDICRSSAWLLEMGHPGVCFYIYLWRAVRWPHDLVSVIFYTTEA